MLYYVGVTINPEQRFYAHKHNGRKAHWKSIPVYRRTQEILKDGCEPQMVILDQITTPHEKIALRLEACWRVEMLRRDETLANSWDTGLCVDHNNPLGEAQMIKGYALATPDELERLKELDIQRAFGLVSTPPAQL
jgi:hypothetical protein